MREVNLADSARDELARLEIHEQLLVNDELALLGKREFDPSSDPLGHQPGQGGHALYARRVSPSIRIWYRMGGYDVYVMVVEKKGEV